MGARSVWEKVAGGSGCQWGGGSGTLERSGEAWEGLWAGGVGDLPCWRWGHRGPPGPSWRLLPAQGSWAPSRAQQVCPGRRPCGQDCGGTGGGLGTPSSSDRSRPWETGFVWKNPGRQVCAAPGEPGGAQAHAWHGPGARPSRGPTWAPGGRPGTWLGAGSRQGSDELVQRPWGGGFGGVAAMGGEEARAGDGFQQPAGSLGPVVELPSPLGREGCRCPRAVTSLPEDVWTPPHCGPPTSAARCPR